MIQHRSAATTVGGQAGNQPASIANGSDRGARAVPDKSAPRLLAAAPAAAAIYGVSLGTFHRLRREGRVPEPIELGPRCLRWVIADLQLAIADMPRKSVANAEPLQLAKARAARSGTTEVNS